MNVDNTKDLTHVSLCTGYGGIDLGLRRVIGSVRTIAYSEIEAYAITNLIAKMEAGLLDSAPIWPNLKTFPFKEFYNKVDILSGGFPCQPFSSGGRRKADGDPRHLFPYIKQGIQQCKPRIVFLENVEGIISSKLKGDEWNDPENTPVLLHILRELERVGYQATAGIFSASETGAPHQRKRVFIMGISNDLPKSERTRVLAMLKPITATAYPSGRNEEQYDFEPARVIIENEPRKPKLKKVKLAYTNGTGLPRTEHEERTTGKERRAVTARPITPSASSFNGLQGQSEPPLGGNVNGSACGVVYGDLQSTGKGDELAYTNGKQLQRLEHEEALERCKISAPSASSFNGLQGQSEPPLGGNVNGSACGVVYGDLSQSYDSPVDEMRLLGNGVVPDVASTAFKVMWVELCG